MRSQTQRPCTPPIAIVKTPPIPEPMYRAAVHVVPESTEQDKWDDCCSKSTQIIALQKTVEDLRLQVADLRRLLHLTQDDVGYFATHVEELTKRADQTDQELQELWRNE